jgi:hypothetical protein
MIRQALRNDPQEDAQNHVGRRPVALHKLAQPFGCRQHPMTHRQAVEILMLRIALLSYSELTFHLLD